MINISWCRRLNTQLNFNLRINHAAYFVVYIIVPFPNNVNMDVQYINVRVVDLWT